MKKAISLLASVTAFLVIAAFTVHKPHTGNWAGLASNQWITYEDVQNGISTGTLTVKSGGTDPALSATKWITCDQLRNWVQLTSTGSTSGNQWITKGDIITINLPYSYSFNLYSGWDNGGMTYPFGWMNSSDACNYTTSGFCTTPFTVTLYSSSSTLSTSTLLYYDQELMYPLNITITSGGCTASGYTTGYWIYSNSLSAPVEIASDGTGRITSIGSCTPVYHYYIATQFSGCLFSASNIVIRSNVSLSSANFVKGTDGYVYRIQTETIAGSYTTTYAENGEYGDCEDVPD